MTASGCSDPPALCQERTKRCLRIETRDTDTGGAGYFEVALTNTCHEDLEYKLCFEIPGENADCRQDYLVPAEHVRKTIALSRFGGRTRIFVRYASEAKACRFPLTRDVEFRGD